MTSDDADAAPRARGRRLGRAAAYAAVTAIFLFVIGFLVRSRWDPLIDLDDAILGATTGFTRTRPGFREALVVWQEASQPLLLHSLGTLLCLWVWLRKGLRTRAWWAFATLMLAWAVGLGAKYVFQRARPVIEDPVSEAPGYSFPSGHALNSAAWTATVVILLWPLVENRVARAAMVAVGTAFVVLTALDRNFLGVHYPTDVTVGVVTGVGLVLASYAGYSGWNPTDPAQARDPDVHPNRHPAVDADIDADRAAAEENR